MSTKINTSKIDRNIIETIIKEIESLPRKLVCVNENSFKKAEYIAISDIRLLLRNKEILEN